MAELGYLSISQAHELLKTKQVSAVELVQYYLDRIEKYDSKVRACLTICVERALAQAKELDTKIAAGHKLGLLEGIPYTAKDMFLVSGVRTTAASKILQNYIAPYSGTAINKLGTAGAILLAKVNQDEYGHGISTENSGFHVTHNPWDESRVPGGSSGGSAAALAADFGIFSLGTDTGGSIRQPASYCGVTGYKPTYGMVSRYGVIAMGSSFDCISPMARSTEDAEIVLSVIAGQDEMDSTTIQVTSNKGQGSSSVGIVKEYADDPIIKEFVSSLSLEPTNVELPNGEVSLATYYILIPSEISSNLERYDGIRYGEVSKGAANLEEVYSKTRDEFFGVENKRRNLTGTYSLSAGYYDAYYKKAMQVRTQICQAFDKIFASVDVIVAPTTLGPAFKIGAKTDPVEMYKEDLLTVPVSLAGLPAISLPAGLDEATGLPLGLQIIGRQGEDGRVLELAKQFQATTDWHKRVEEIKL